MDWIAIGFGALLVLAVIVFAVLRRGRSAPRENNPDGATPDPGLAQTADITSSGAGHTGEEDGDKV